MKIGTRRSDSTVGRVNKGRRLSDKIRMYAFALKNFTYKLLNSG